MSGKIEPILPDWPAPPGVKALVTTRAGGVSSGAWSSLNLGAHCGDTSENVAENRQRLTGMLPDAPVWLRQVHGTEIYRHQGDASICPEADAIVARHAGRVCAVLTADCVPVLICDRTGTVVAATHAGWRGLLAGVLEATISAMEVIPGELLAWLGPAIGPLNYEVGEEVRQSFINIDSTASSAFAPSGDRWLANLFELARQRLAGAGVAAVSGGTHCTFSDPERFYSYRRDGATGRMASLIWFE